MGWRTTLGLTLAGLAVAGCLGGASPSPSPEPSPAVWETDITSEGEAIPVRLVDFTGLVAGVREGDRMPSIFGSQWLLLSQSPDEEPGLVLTLIGSPCEQAFELAVRTVGDHLVVSWVASPRPGCDTIAVSYYLEVDLAQAIEADRLMAHDVNDEGPSSWGFMVPGSDGLSRPMKLVAGRRDLVRATPLDASAFPLVTGDVGVGRPLAPADVILVAWASEACEDEMTLSAFPGQPLEIGLADTKGLGCGGPKHLQGVALTFHPNTDTSGIEAVVVENR
jgi:hypothetical protein